MTYRLDSDVPRPYGWIEPQGERRTVPPRDSDGAGWIDFNEADFAKSLESRCEKDVTGISRFGCKYALGTI